MGLSHQAAVLHENAPLPDDTDMIGKLILKHYAPVTAHYGFHFKAYGPRVSTPVIRQQVRDQKVENHGHYTVYLPAYDDKRLIKRLTDFPEIEWDVFSKHNKKTFRYKNVSIQPINNEAFIKSMATSAGVLCGAGFETPAEALYMQKKLLVIPMKTQYEQHLNAAALKELGVPVVKSLKEKHYPTINEWINNGKQIKVNFPDNTQQVLDVLFKELNLANTNLATA